MGANLVRALLAQDWSVRALVRGAAPSLEGLAIERVPGDLFVPELSAAMAGCDAVFHVAATYSLWRRDRAEVVRANVEGTRLVLGAARRAGVPRVVHTSSVAAIGVRKDGAPANEMYQSAPGDLIGAYKRSKYEAEIEVQRAEVNVTKMSVKAPMDGIVVMQSIVRNGEYGQVREGDQVNAGQPFLTIVDPSSMVLNATVNQVDAERLRLGMKATMHLDAYPEIELPGSLIGIGAMSKTSTFRAGFVGEIPIRLRIDKMDPRVIPDLTGSAEVVLGSERNAVLVPRAAVFEENGGSFVFVQGAEGFTKKQVQLGLSSFTNVAIQSGLEKGDVVALQRPL